MNKHKGMKLIKIWLTEAEILSLKECLKEYHPETVNDIIFQANERRDIQW